MCLAVYAAAAIAVSSPWRTAWEAIRLGFINYILPFLIVLSPSLLLIGNASEIASAIVTSLSGATMLILAAQGWAFTRATIIERVLMASSGVMLLWVEPWLEGIGGALAISLLFSSWRRSTKGQNTSAQPVRSKG